ncbi:MAG TPA: hypothetical protein VN759_02240 [Pseudolysinimonas sp.]|nr:hypothetical protein [Pseudolysinimonas sp.]
MDPFLTREHAEQGLTRARLRSRAVAHPYTAVNVVGAPPTTVIDRARAYVPLLARGECFSHVTAAAIWGAQLPPSLESADELHVTAVGRDLRARGRGVRGHRALAGTIRARVHLGLPVIEPTDCWVQLAPLLAPDDLVAVGDRFVTGRRVEGGRSTPVTSVAELRRAIHRHAGGRGLKRARWAIELVRVGVDSRQESRLRLHLVRAGFPEPRIGVAIDVGWPAPLHPDLAWPELRIAFEYEGDQHRSDRERWRRDIARKEAMEGAGWRVIRVTADDLPDAGFARRVRGIRERARIALSGA